MEYGVAVHHAAVVVDSIRTAELVGILRELELERVGNALPCAILMRLHIVARVVGSILLDRDANVLE